MHEDHLNPGHLRPLLRYGQNHVHGLSLGTLQCQDNDNAELRLIQLSTLLTEAEIKIASAAISHDGRSRPAVCGAADGKIGLFKIPSKQLQRAQQLGYSLLESD